MLSNEVKECAKKIGKFFLERNGGSYDATADEIDAIHITKLEIVDGVVQITAARVGRLIGRRGETIDKLTEFLAAKVKIFEDEDPLINYLIPHEPDPYEGY